MFGVIEKLVVRLFSPRDSVRRLLLDIEEGRVKIKDSHVREVLDDVKRYETMSPDEKREFDRKTNEMERELLRH